MPRFRPGADKESAESQARLLQATPLGDRLGATWSTGRAPGGGVYVTRVPIGSPAQRGGLQQGDRIVRLDGCDIQTADDLTGAVATAPTPATAIVQRPGQAEPLSLTVPLEGKPLRLGITWHVDDAEPGTVVLTQVVPGSPAAAAGVRVGDRVYQVAGREFSDDAQFAMMVTTLPGPLALLVERDGRVQAVIIHFHSEPMKRAA